MIHLYFEEGLSTRECAAATGHSATTVCCILTRTGRPRRSVAEAKAGQKPAAHTILASVRARRKHVVPGMPEVGYKLRRDGYLQELDPTHPNATGCGYVLAHRKTMAKLVGRPLHHDEDVHHRDEVLLNNDPENLKLLSHAEHLREHSKTRQRRVNGTFA